MTERPIAMMAADAPPRGKASVYPEPFADRVAGRVKQPLGNLFGLANFGVNRTVLPPGAVSALRHRHSKQDEFIYIIKGTPTLVTDDGEVTLEPDMCAGFPAGGAAHMLENRSAGEVVYLEIGDRTPGDTVTYPDDDLAAVMAPDGQWRFTHKDGTPY